MCTLIKKLNVKQVTGYKLVTKYDGKYYSPVTGVEYKKGEKITPVLSMENIVRPYISRRSGGDPTWNIIAIFVGFYYNLNFAGKTMICKKLEDAEKLLEHHHRSSNPLYWEVKDEIIIKMTLSGEIWESEFDATHGTCKTYSGTMVKKIVENFIKS